MEIESPSAAAWKDIDFKRLTRLNIGKVRSLMKKDNIDAIFVHHSDSFQYVTGYLNPTYFNSFSSPFRQAAIVLAEEDEPIMLAGAADYHDAKNFYWIKDTRSMPARFNLWPKLIKKALQDHGLKSGKLAIDSHSPYTLVDELKQELKNRFTFTSAGPILATARSVKNSEEIKVIRRAAGLATAMVVAAKQAVREGVREIDVAVEAERVLLQLEPLAHTSFKTVVMSGDRAAYLDRIPSNKVIGNGDLLNIDAGCYYLGYLSEFGRGVMVGKPTKEQKNLYRAGFEAEQEAIKAIKPGVKTSVIDRIAREVIKLAGFEKYQHPHYTGHGHGLSGHDLPIVGDPGQTTDYTFEPGMVVAIEPGVFKPGVGGVREEDVVLVTETGHEILSKVGYEDRLLD